MLYIQRLERSERLLKVVYFSAWVGGCDVNWQHNLQQVGVCSTVTVQNQFKDVDSTSFHVFFYA